LLYRRNAIFARRAAVRAIAANPEAGQFPALRDMLEVASRDPSPWVRGERAARACDLATYREWIQKDRDGHVRSRALESIAHLEGDGAAREFEMALQDPDFRVAAGAAALLGRAKCSRVHELLRLALRHPRGIVRENAAESFGEIYKEKKNIQIDDVEEVVRSILSCRGEDLAESRSSLIATLEMLETARREGLGETRNIAAEREQELASRIRVALLDNATDPDPTVQLKVKSAIAKLLDPGPMPPILVPPPPVAAIPGANAPAFERDPRVRIATNKGSFDITLFSRDAPVHAENFLQLAARGHYNNTAWHRVEFNFVVQGGDHLGDGTGSVAAWGGCLRDEINRRKFVRGTLGMPKSEAADSGGCQLFITHIPTPHLDGRYTAFGQVTAGLEVIDRLELGDSILNIEILDPGRSTVAK
jgi:cyclophilin family peptidyl-prolyl cis-trans isomerase